MKNMLNNTIFRIAVVCLCLAHFGCASVPNDPPGNFNAAEFNVGVIFLHAKWREPHSIKVAPLIDEMRSAGMLVVQPEMPWSRKRSYDEDYETVMLEIHQIVTDMRSKGITWVLVGGNSFGANAAIGYAARYSDVDGVIAVAPGQLPDIGARGKIYGDSVERAEQMVKEGKGEEQADFTDVNQGKKITVRMSAHNYVSYFKPDGPAVIPLNISKMNNNTALYWVVGEKDKVAWMGKHYAYNKAPLNSLNEYLETTGGHLKTPDFAKHEIVQWIKKVVNSGESNKITNITKGQTPI